SAEAAGLDALGILISETHLPRSAFADGIRLAAEVAQDSKVKLIPDLWDAWNLAKRPPTRERLIEYGRSVKDLMDRYPKAFFIYDGRPVISLGNPLRDDVETPFRWSDYQAVFEPWGGAKNLFIVLNSRWRVSAVGDAWGRAADAFSAWAATQGWNDPHNTVLFD